MVLDAKKITQLINCSFNYKNNNYNFYSLDYDTFYFREAKIKCITVQEFGHPIKIIGSEIVYSDQEIWFQVDKHFDFKDGNNELFNIVKSFLNDPTKRHHSRHSEV